MPKQVKWAHFRARFKMISPFLVMYAPSCTLRKSRMVEPPRVEERGVD